ncbi:MAG: hypothetical protein WA902_02865 [Thermosynechococcaceae cyanobacterium]
MTNTVATNSKDNRDRIDQHSQPTLSYWHVWTDDDGISHQTCCQLTHFEQESMGGDADPQWNNRLLSADAEVLFSVLPVGWEGEWHENPKPQWIIPLSGRWFVETMDGNRIEMGAGNLSFGGDQNTVPNAKGHRGHRSGTVGQQPAVLMVIQLNDERWKGARLSHLD